MVLLYSFFLVNGRAYGIGEKILTLGSASSWEAIEKWQGITEAPLIRPQPVLVLAGMTNALTGKNPELGLDLQLSFNEILPVNFIDSRGRYEVSISSELTIASAPLSRYGSGAALFSGKANNGPVILKPMKNALFAPGNHVRDFSIEFWLYPMNLDNGEQILSFNSSKPETVFLTGSDRSSTGAFWVGRGNDISRNFIPQSINCVIAKNRIQWIFEDFFFSPDERSSKSLALTGTQIIPRTWSHHLIRFDADLGLLEYLVDGRIEALDYTTSTGREAGEVYTPVIGENCRLTLGSRFSGMMDEFHIYSGWLDSPELAKYPSNGRVETRSLDLGRTNSRLIKIEAFGGRTAISSGTVRNEYNSNGILNFGDYSGVNFFVRTSNEPYRWNDIPWVPVKCGADLQDAFRGRYVQIAADFYPSWDGEASPYLAELRIVYQTEDPPPAPTQIIAMAKDGAVELSWKASLSGDVGGYLIYYGTAKGEYFGNYGIMASPIDAGNRTSFRVEGLNNGTLYYFAVAAYSAPISGSYFAGARNNNPEPGEFSREAAARPLRMAE